MGGLEVTVQSSLRVPVACRKGHRGHDGVGRSLDGSVGVAWKGHERAAVIDGFARSCRRGHIGSCGQGREGHRSSLQSMGLQELAQRGGFGW